MNHQVEEQSYSVSQILMLLVGDQGQVTLQMECMVHHESAALVLPLLVVV